MKSLPLDRPPKNVELSERTPNGASFSVGDIYLVALPVPVVQVLNGIAAKKKTTLAVVLGEALSTYIESQ